MKKEKEINQIHFYQSRKQPLKLHLTERKEMKWNEKKKIHFIDY